MFYRETITKGSRYVAVSEGILDVYKSPYVRRTGTQGLLRVKI